MKNKRLLLFLLVGGGILAIAAILFFVFKPFQQSSQIPAQPDVPQQRVFNPQEAVPKLPEATGTPPSADDPAEAERQAQEALKRQAVEYAARQGTYSSVDGFAAVKTVYDQSTQAVQDFLKARSDKLITQYPSYGPSYGRTTRALSATIVSGTPILSGTEAHVDVQTQVILNDVQAQETVSYELVGLNLKKEAGVWLVSDITVEPLNL